MCTGTTRHPLKTEATYEDLERISRNAKRAAETDSRRRVPIAELLVAEKVFQWRREHSDLQTEERHMRELMRVLELGRELAPIVVTPIGKKRYVVDGHHRLAAYAALGRKIAPVVHLNDSLQDAWLHSLDANIRDKLPITRQDKYEAAFTLVKHKVTQGLKMTWEEIAQRANVSERVVYKMQSMLKEGLAKGKEALVWSWGETLRRTQSATTYYDDEDGEAFRNEHARKLADQIMSKVHIKLTGNPDITAEALRMISEQLPRALIEEWEAEAIDVLLQQALDADSDEAYRTLKAGFGLLQSARFEREEKEFQSAYDQLN